jgi:Tol biopolymer transport system component
MNVDRLELTGQAVPVVEDVESSPGSAGAAEFDISPNGALVYLRRQNGRQTLIWLDSMGYTQPLRSVAADYEGPRFSPDGKRLAVPVVEAGNTDVWVYEWERDTMTRLTSDPGFDGWPVWSPSGRHIVFTSGRHGGAWNLYWMRADGTGEAVRLTESKESQFPGSFSPDGKRFAFGETNPQTNFDLWTLRLEEPESDRPKPGKPEPFLVTPFAEDSPMISPDGRWLAYVSDESGNKQVYVRPFPGPGGKWQISTGGGDIPVWSRKAQALFYRSLEGMMVSSYTAMGEAFAASRPSLWAEKKNLRSYDLSPDGKRFATVQAEASEQKGPANVTFLLNFFDELRRRAPAGGK